MTAILRSMSLSLITLAFLPAWQFSRGQDSPATTTLSGEKQQPEQNPPGTTPNPPQTTTPPPPAAATTSSTLDDTVDAGEMDDDIELPRRGMAKWEEYHGATSQPEPAWA